MYIIEATVPDERFDSEPGVSWSKLRNDGHFAVFDWPSDIPIKRGLSETNTNMIIKRIEGKDSEWKDIEECDRITFRLYTDFLYMYILEPTFKDYITKKCKDY
jgi:hypothetical protein